MHNITKEEKKALFDLMKDDNLATVLADKGRCVVVLNKSDYNHEKCKEFLTNYPYVQMRQPNPTSGYRKKVVSLIKKLFENNIINVMLKRKLIHPQN